MAPSTVHWMGFLTVATKVIQTVALTYSVVPMAWTTVDQMVIQRALKMEFRRALMMEFPKVSLMVRLLRPGNNQG